MNNKKLLLTATAIAGLLTGLIVSGIFQAGDNDSTYCNSIEQEIKANQTFNGSVACYPPGVLDVNLSQRVEDSADLRCVCRIIDDSGARIYPVAESK